MFAAIDDHHAPQTMPHGIVFAVFDFLRQIDEVRKPTKA
jgi:hypothetical protein